jgi:leucyl aminopeptidase
LAYAQERISPNVVVDIATLTGAATLGLSRHYGALYSDDTLLAGQLVVAGQDTGELLWRMPLVESYRASLHTPIADIAQTASDHRVRAGSIMAALYLQRFAGDLTWAHIDMAGSARAEKPYREHPVGSTGFGARLLAQWLRTADLSAFTSASA